VGDSSFSMVWLNHWMKDKDIVLWGVADLMGFSPPADERGRDFPFALSWAEPMNPHIMEGIQGGPNQAYADEYDRANRRINQLARELAGEITMRGFSAMALAASERTDKESIMGAFPHKSAATRAGLGWIGRHCQLITKAFGPWVRLGTVFTDMPVAAGNPAEKQFCGSCTRCADACPAGALTGQAWHPGVPRDSILDVHACDRWKKEHYFRFHQGHNCGICSAACPYGRKILKRQHI